MKKRRNWIKRILLLAVIAAIIGAWALIPSVKQGVNEVLFMFASGDFTAVREFVASYGGYAALISFLLTFANASLFGWWRGAILSWTSAMAGAAVCFVIARVLGRDAAERLTSRTGLRQIDTFFEKYGKNTVLICRLLPFMSFDIVSYAAGLTSMSFGAFFIATGIGQLPATLVYSYVGGMLTGGAKLFVTGLFILFALSALIVLARNIYTDRQKREQA